jgi:hypothetical protein
MLPSSRCRYHLTLHALSGMEHERWMHARDHSVYAHGHEVLA